MLGVVQEPEMGGLQAISDSGGFVAPTRPARLSHQIWGTSSEKLPPSQRLSPEPSRRGPSWHQPEEKERPWFRMILQGQGVVLPEEQVKKLVESHLNDS